MKILVVGNGGREHALLWRLAQDRPTAEFLITRGSPGTHVLARSVDVSPSDVPAVVRTAREEMVDLVVVGPEAPLAAGLVDRLEETGIPAFGPSAAAARIETSKVFAKELMREIGVPTASFETFESIRPARSYVNSLGDGCVVKADGLAGGKGAMVCHSREQALDALDSVLVKKEFGAAGEKVVVEELMTGEELSVLALVDGSRVLTLVPSQDHKPVGEGDTGPNTGGMGSYAPVSLVDPALMRRIETTILDPVVAAMAGRGTPYKGCLYAGLMLTSTGPKVIEFNCRFGDPETQVVLPLLDGDLVSLLLASAGGRLQGLKAGTRKGAAVCVVLASGGYPGQYQKGKEIRFDPSLAGREDLLVFHAGTAESGGRVVTNGGRVLGVTGLGADVTEAARKAYEAVSSITFEGMYYRRDIARREICRQVTP